MFSSLSRSGISEVQLWSVWKSLSEALLMSGFSKAWTLKVLPWPPSLPILSVIWALSQIHLYRLLFSRLKPNTCEEYLAHGFPLSKQGVEGEVWGSRSCFSCSQGVGRDERLCLPGFCLLPVYLVLDPIPCHCAVNTQGGFPLTQISQKYFDRHTQICASPIP